jgi:hypothetical protein
MGEGMELLVMSYYRAHQVSVLRLVLVVRDPLAPDTDQHRRRIRERVVDCRADGCAGRDEKDVGVRSCSCGVAVWLRRKVLLEWLTGTAGMTHAKSGTLFCLERARYESCARARMVLSTAGIVQQLVEWYGAGGGKSSLLIRIRDSPLPLVLQYPSMELPALQLIAWSFSVGFEALHRSWLRSSGT